MVSHGRLTVCTERPQVDAGGTVGGVEDSPEPVVIQDHRVLVVRVLAIWAFSCQRT